MKITDIIRFLITAQKNICCACLIFSCSLSAPAPSWANMYENTTLSYWQKEFIPRIQENFHKVIIPALNQDQRQILIRSQLTYPKSSGHPLSFNSNPKSGIINLPISSLRFLGDLCIAYVWLNDNKISLDHITNYLLVLKYQGVQGFTNHNAQPLAALGIPDEAKSNPKTQQQTQQLFSTAVVFLLAHEMGHIYHQHETANLTPAMSQSQEMAADDFALEVMKKIGAVPIGAVPFFLAYAHLDPLHGDTDFTIRRTQATHPTSPERLHTLANELTLSAKAFGNDEKNTQATLYTAGQIKTIADILNQPSIQGMMRMKGLTTTPEMLRIPAVGNSDVLPVVTENESSGTQNYGGKWRGKWTQTRGAVVDLPVTLILQQSGIQVQGYYDFGAGKVLINGTISQNVLYYKWKWGDDYFGRGTLRVTSSQQMTGSWGYTESDSGSGIWTLKRD